MMHRALLVLALALVAAGALLAPRRRDDAPRAEDRRTTAAWFAAAMAAFLLRAIAEVLRGRVPGSVDDFNRLGYAMQWADKPFFAQADHLWLTGPHAAIGAMIRMVGDPMLALLGWSLAAWAVLVVAMFRVGRVANVPVAWAGAGAIAMACFPVAVPLLVSPLPDVMHAALVLLVLAELIELWRGSGRRNRAVVFAGLATTLRFEAWPLAVVVVLAAIADLARARQTARLRQFFVIPVATAFPIIWMADADNALGHPLAFARPPLSPLFHHYTWGGELRFDPNAAIEFGGRMRDLLFVAKLFAWQALPLLPALAWLWRRNPAAARTLALVSTAWLALAAVVTLGGGIAGHAPERLFLVAMAPLLVAFGGIVVECFGVGPAPSPVSRFARLVGAVLVSGFIVHATVLTMRHGGRLLEHMDTSCIAAGERLRRELGDAPEFLEHLPPDERIFVWGLPARGTQGEFHAIRALSGRPDRVRVFWTDVPPIDARIALFADLPPDMLDAYGYRILAQDGSWALCARRWLLDDAERDDLRVGGTEAEPTLIDDAACLEWATCAPAELLDFNDARAWADGLAFGGHDDWRLPTKDELWLLRDTGRENEPSIDARFSGESPLVWSGERVDLRSAWAIDLSREWVAPRLHTYPASARAVRSSVRLRPAAESAE